jgi:cytochrome c-type biogenesis protein CcmH
VGERIARWWPAVVATVLLAIIGLGLSGGAGATADRGEHLARQLRCPVCQGESIADSTSTTAREMRSQIDGFVDEGRSDAWILTYYEDRYGRWIRLSPPLTGDTVLLWASPALALAGGMVVVQRRRRAAPAADLDGEDRERLRAELELLRRDQERS